MCISCGSTEIRGVIFHSVDYPPASLQGWDLHRPEHGSVVAQWLTHMPLVLEVRGLISTHGKEKFQCPIILERGSGSM